MSPVASPPPPDDEFFFSSGADAVWAGIARLPEPAKHMLLARLRASVSIPELDRTPERERLARAISALHEAYAALQLELLADGGDPSQPQLSVRAYERLREAHPGHGWPREDSVRRWLGGGSWPEALRRAALPSVPEGDALVVHRTSTVTAEELVAAVTECAAELTYIPSLTDYLHWAKRREVRLRPGRRPRSQNTVARLFPDGWDTVLIAAELLAAGQTGRLGIGGVVRPAKHSYDDDDVLDALRQAAGVLGESPSVAQYTAWRARELDPRAGQAGDPRRADGPEALG